MLFILDDGMSNLNPNRNSNLNTFLYPKTSGKVEPTIADKVFNAKLQRYAQQAMYLTSLETGGKISLEDCYNTMKVMWQDLERSREYYRQG
ncbi:hypothetical protein E1H12_09910 [Geitlerinema sp. P-1104]|uniref:DUF7219 family protein n=2 Tax=Cyanophyceae TaxID=3028117 RepID=UPI001359A964|nr:hypothetical protein [Geitlerinema sp. P-1104]NMG58831.1 hypothetical protein [Geitlerinema sp. P-1104]